MSMYYKIRETLVPCRPEEIRDGDAQYVAVLSPEEWTAQRDLFDMGIDMEMDLSEPIETKAVVNQDSLTGSVSVPDRELGKEGRHCFLFALDEKGVVLIDYAGYAARLVQDLEKTKKWRTPSLERFLYDLLEMIIDKDLTVLQSFENRLNRIEDEILTDQPEEFPPELNEIRGKMLDLHIHYEQMIDLGQELEENENGFFRHENVRFFRLFTERITRLQESVSSLRENSLQLRDLVQSLLTIRQNKIMTILTVVTSIFLPLTLIAGWYGMNFRYMPELNMRYAYPVVIVISILIVVFSLLWFRKKKWM